MDTTIFIIPAIPVTTTGLLSYWTGFVLFCLFCMAVYQLEKKTELKVIESLHPAGLILIFLIFSRQFKGMGFIEKIFNFIFYLTFPVWFIARFVYSFWFF